VRRQQSKNYWEKARAANLVAKAQQDEDQELREKMQAVKRLAVAAKTRAIEDKVTAKKAKSKAEARKKDRELRKKIAQQQKEIDEKKRMRRGSGAAQVQAAPAEEEYYPSAATLLEGRDHGPQSHVSLAEAELEAFLQEHQWPGEEDEDGKVRFVENAKTDNGKRKKRPGAGPRGAGAVPRKARPTLAKEEGSPSRREAGAPGTMAGPEAPSSGSKGSPLLHRGSPGAPRDSFAPGDGHVFTSHRGSTQSPAPHSSPVHASARLEHGPGQRRDGHAAEPSARPSPGTHPVDIPKPSTPLSRERLQKENAGVSMPKMTAASQPLEPWERFVKSRIAEVALPEGLGRVPFFDLSSNAQKGRFRVHDARGFVPESMRRAASSEHPGVVFLMGRRPESHPTFPNADQVITVIFDRSTFDSEFAAEKWWNQHKDTVTQPNPAV